MISIQSIIDNINDDTAISKDGLINLQEYIHKYQYFQIGYAILAKKNILSRKDMRKALMYVPDKEYLKKLIENKAPFDRCDITSNEKYRNKYTSLQKKTPKAKETEEEKIYADKNDYKKEITERKEKNIYSEKVNRQKAIIEDFLSKKSLKTSHAKNCKCQNDDLSLSSSTLSPDLLNENLMQLYTEQGKIDKVLEICDVAATKNPEKKTIFGGGTGEKA